MMGRMEESLALLVEDITVNVGYPIYFENLDILLAHQFYFDISRLVFPQLNIKIIKIAEDQTLDPVHKIQMLLHLLTNHLQIQFSSFSPTEILKGNYFHIHPFLKVLKQFSDHRPEEIQQQRTKTLRRVKTFPILEEQDKNSIYPKTAREKMITLQPENQNSGVSAKYKQNFPSHSHLSSYKEIEDEQEIMQEGQEKKEEQIGQASAKKEKKKRKIAKNKNNKSGLLIQKSCNNLNKKYHAYLQKLMKPSKSRKRSQNSRNRPKSAKPRTWVKDIQQIDDFFASFASKLDSQKQKYIRKMEQIVRAKQNERMWDRNKQMRETIKKSEAKFERQLSRLSHAHQTRKELLKEENTQTKQSLCLMKKQLQKNLRDERKELRERKKKELKQIKNYIEHLNDKIFMKFEEGGYYQKMVLDLYKKY